MIDTGIAMNNDSRSSNDKNNLLLCILAADSSALLKPKVADLFRCRGNKTVEASPPTIIDTFIFLSFPLEGVVPDTELDDHFLIFKEVVKSMMVHTEPNKNTYDHHHFGAHQCREFLSFMSTHQSRASQSLILISGGDPNVGLRRSNGFLSPENVADVRRVLCSVSCVVGISAGAMLLGVGYPLCVLFPPCHVVVHEENEGWPSAAAILNKDSNAQIIKLPMGEAVSMYLKR